jgi:hypothetical protein
MGGCICVSGVLKEAEDLFQSGMELKVEQLTIL